MAYHGVKFSTRFIGETVPCYNEINDLIYWCNTFAEKGLAPLHPEGSYGNLSIRVKDGILITRTSLDLNSKLSINDFVLVTGCNLDCFITTCIGTATPSSETPIHWKLYFLRPDINAIFHGHHDELLQKGLLLNIPETKREQPYGSLELVHEVELLANFNFFNMKNHGFISLGKDMLTAGEQALAQISLL